MDYSDVKFVMIDGARGEGGGQIVRSALTLSAITGKSFRIVNIRRNRPNPGLRNQHVRCVLATQRVCSAEVEGAEKASRELSFVPGKITAGKHEIDIGTAGSTGLVLQTIALPLSLAEGSSEVVIRGGTHNHFAPIYDYLDLQWLPFMRRIGLDIDLELVSPGFYPKGGGEIRATIRPAAGFFPLLIADRGKLKRLTIRAAVDNLPRNIAERFIKQTASQLKSRNIRKFKTEIRTFSGVGRGTYVFLFAEYENSGACYFGLGKIGKKAEKIADEMVEEFIEFHRSEATVDKYLADQLLLPLALCGDESTFSTPRITRHLLTNADVIRKFTDVEIIVGKKETRNVVTVRPRASG